MRRKIGALLLAVCVLVTVGGCEKSGVQADPSGGDDAREEMTGDEGEAKESGGGQETPTETEEIPGLAGPQVLYDQDGLTITAAAFGMKAGRESSGLAMDPEPTLTLTVANQGEEYLSVNPTDVSVNGCMTTDYWMCDESVFQGETDAQTVTDAGAVEAGQTRTFYLQIYGDTLKKYGIEQIAEVEVGFLNYVGEAFGENRFRIPPCVIRTTLADSFTQTFDDAGSLAYEDANCRIVFRGREGTDAGGDACRFVFYVENKLENPIHIVPVIDSYNGVAVRDKLEETEKLWQAESAASENASINAGRKGYMVVRIVGDALKLMEIEDLEEISLHFRIQEEYEENQWQDVVEDTPAVAYPVE